ncbi:flavocytochrome c [Gordonibacter sp. An230]|uniref:flavocytochrome c n=1 Tax=Gordonibacter sp. An230 TaxID=1965592 RepID=UPI000B554BA9|nr:flavocytochrome c [Gordonibacter sp. An230]OUO89824.1 flavocytochrome c [Gordonibacter sp. An230]
MSEYRENGASGQKRSYRLTRRSFVAGVGAMGALGVLGSFGLTGCAPSGDKAADGADEGAGESYDAVIVGTGGAGLSAAIAAYDKGLTNIVILEKMAVNGGNTNFSSSGMNASETKFQKEQGIEDSNDLFAQETLDGGHNTGDPELVQFMCDNSAGAIDWLDGLGVKLDNITLTGGMSVKRCHRPTDGSAVGLTLIPGLLAAVEERGIPTKMSCEAKELVKDGDAVTGVKVDLDGKETVIGAKAVILATGGLGANAEMVTKYRPDLEGYVTTNQPGATGDGYTMAEQAGAELVQMEQIQIHPTVEQETSTLIAEGVRGGGAILVNSEGNRFFDEMSTRDKVSAAELEQPGGFAWCVFDQQVYDANTAIAKYEKSGLVQKGGNVAELAEAIEVDPAALQATIDAYNAITTDGAADEFGRTEGCIAFADGNMYAIKVAPGIHHEMGGVKINEKNEALDASGNPIPGLYAAGEVTGGIHGDNRIGGNAVCDIIVFGRNVGEVVADALA